MSTRNLSRRLLGTTVAVAAAALPLLTAQAATADSDSTRSAGPPSARGGLLLTVSGDEQTWTRGTRLFCTPVPHGNHPKAAEACAALDRARGDLGALPNESGVCTMEYAPVTVTAQGSHQGRSVAWKKTFPNSCAMHQATGPVFDF